MSASDQPKMRTQLKVPDTANTTVPSDPTSGTKPIAFERSTTVVTTTTERYVVDQSDIVSLQNEMMKLMAKVVALESRLAVRESEQSTDQTEYTEMKRIAEEVISKGSIPNGKVIAITHDGKLVAEAENITDLLIRIHNMNRDDIFIWQSGSDEVTSW